MTIIEALRGWLRTYPPLSKGRLAVDFLPKEARTYSVDSVPCKEEVRRYLDGSSVRQFLFTLSSREFKGEDIAQNTDNLAFYEGFSAWVLAQDRARRLPDLGEGRDREPGRSRSLPAAIPSSWMNTGRPATRSSSGWSIFKKGEGRS